MARSKRQASGGGTKSKASVKKKAGKSKEVAARRQKRRLEVLGLVVMALAVLLALAVATYHPSDDALASHLSPSTLFNTTAPSVSNAMGLVGAYLAWLSVPNSFGYPIVLIAFVLLGFGLSLFRGWSLRVWARYAALSVWIVVILSTYAGWTAIEPGVSAWSGSVGSSIAAFLVRALGNIGTGIVLLFGSLVAMRLAIDADTQRVIDVFSGWFQTVRRAVARWWSARETKRAEDAVTARKKDLEERVAARRAKALETPERVVSVPVPGAVPDRAEIVNDAFRDQSDVAGETAPATGGNDLVETPPADKGGHSGALSLHVRERVEEEKANLDDRGPEKLETGIKYKYPPVELLDDDSQTRPKVDYDELEENKQILLDKLETYNIGITKIDAVVGPTVTLYELTPAPGVKISRIKSLEDDLALAMAARGIRIIAPIPGKSAIGVEIPNRYRELVQVSSVLNTARFRDADMELPIAIGKTIEGEVYVVDLVKMPHLLIAGATGSGKSVGLNNLIANLLYACHPDNLKFVMIDPKRVELQQYARIFDHFIAMPEGAEDPITTEFSEASGVLNSCLREMELRYDLLSSAGVRTIKEYNKRFSEGRITADDEDHRHLPYIVVVVDELADLMMTTGKDIEGPIARLAQMARAVGIHLVVATQRPSVNVITGLIKANFPSRVAFQVASGIDSRTIIDQYGAEQLVGNGDLLFMAGSHITRLQSPFISLDEIEAITTFIADQVGGGPYLLPKIEKKDEDGTRAGLSDADVDPLFRDAARTIVRNQQGSVSLLQRKLSVGYARAARIVDQLEQAGVVGPFEGSKARQVLLSDEMQLDQFLKERSGEDS